MEINGTIYSLLYNGSYYIEDTILISTNILYNVFKFVNILSVINNNNSIATITVDRDINPQKYYITDPILQPSFAITGANNIQILTGSTLLVQFNGTLGSTMTHTYNFKESIPYRINSIVNENKYFYQMTNINSIRLNDSIRIFDNMTEYITSLYSVDGIPSSSYPIIFTLDTNVLPSILNNMLLEIKKLYDLTIVSFEGSTITCSIPTDFTDYNYDYTYYVEIDSSRYNIILDIVKDLSNNPMFSITLPVILNPNISYTVILEQDLIIQNNISSLPFNTLYSISTIYDSTVQNISSYYIPIIQTLDPNMNKFKANYYYKFTPQNYVFTDSIYIVDGNYIEATIISVQSDYIIGTNTLIEPKTIKIYTNDFKYSEVVQLSNASYIYQKGVLLQQLDGSYSMLFNDNSLENYNYADEETNNITILSFKYSDIVVTNTSYSNIGYNVYPSVINTTTINNTKYNDVKWVDNLAINLFNSIQFTIDDNVIEKLDNTIYTIYINYLIDMWKRNEFNKMTQLRYDTSNNLYFFLPIINTFTLEPSSYLPISSMNRSVIKLKFITNTMPSLITNNRNGYSKQVYPMIDIHYDYIITGAKMVTIKSPPFYMLLKCLYPYNNFIVNNLQQINNINLYNRTIELFLITTTSTGQTTLIKSNGYKRDSWYSEYLSNNIIDYSIFDLIDNEISIKSKRYLILSNNPIITDIRFAMYLDEKYLQYIDENLNNTIYYSQKITLLILYFTKIHINQPLTTSTDIISSLNIQINGNDLLPTLPSSYHNNTIPFIKGYILPDGYYMYSFSLDSLSPQPNGMFNLKNIKDLAITTSQVELNEYRLKVCTREYRILKIDNYIGKMI